MVKGEVKVGIALIWWQTGVEPGLLPSFSRMGQTGVAAAQTGGYLSSCRSSLQAVLPHTVALMTNLSLPLDPGLRALLSHLILPVLQTGSV